MSEAADFELRQVSVLHDGVPALDAVDLRVAAGEALALVGPSGAGKTTLLRLLGAQIEPDRGEVRMFGRPLNALPRAALRELRARVGFVHQDLALVPNLRVQQNVSAGRLGSTGLVGALRSLAWPARSELEAVHELLERVGIADKLFARTDTLSGGERQRVAIARALHQRPRALLADEPVSSVDPARARDTVSLLRSVCEERGLSCVLSLHQLELARACFPRLVGLRAGRLIFDRPAEAVGEAEFRQLYALDGPEVAG